MPGDPGTPPKQQIKATDIHPEARFILLKADSVRNWTVLVFVLKKSSDLE